MGGDDGPAPEMQVAGWLVAGVRARGSENRGLLLKDAGGVLDASALVRRVKTEKWDKAGRGQSDRGDAVRGKGKSV